MPPLRTIFEQPLFQKAKQALGSFERKPYTPEQTAAMKRGYDKGMQLSEVAMGATSPVKLAKVAKALPVGRLAGLAKGILAKKPPSGVLDEMAKFTEYVRAKAPLTKLYGEHYANYPKEVYEADIREMAQSFGIPDMKNVKLADMFDEVLSRARYGLPDRVQTRDMVGRFGRGFLKHVSPKAIKENFINQQLQPNKAGVTRATRKQEGFIRRKAEDLFRQAGG